MVGRLALVLAMAGAGPSLCSVRLIEPKQYSAQWCREYYPRITSLENNEALVECMSTGLRKPTARQP